MSERISDLISVTTVTSDGQTIPKYSNFRAVIPVAENRRHGGTQVTVRIEADNADHDESCCDGGPAMYLFETDIPGAHVDDAAAEIMRGAQAALAAQGFEPAGLGWSYTGDQQISTSLAPLGGVAAAVTQVLAELGDTADAVADFLRARGIKGDQVDCLSCPIANLLVQLPGVETVEVNDFSMVLWTAHDSVLIVLPKPVAEFINRFDNGVYLDLVRQDTPAVAA